MAAGCNPASAAKVKNDHSITSIAFSGGLCCRRESTGISPVGTDWCFFFIRFDYSDPYDLVHQGDLFS
ncbi:hypothetical protein J5839_04245 [Methanosarcinaceae archaeon]|nr:hypothetical protein [Methanosarcinaceae archaeon]